MTDDEILAVVQAHKEGKQIQWSHPSKQEWYDFEGQPEWNFAQFSYRVKPEPRKPREWWVGANYHAYNYEYEAERTGTCIKVREVIKE